MSGSEQHFQTPDAGHELFPLGKQDNLSHVLVLPVRHPGTDSIISGHHVASGNPITTEPVLKYPDANKETATHI